MLRFDTTRQRSQNMRAIKSNSNATTELRLRGHLISSQIVGWKVRPKGILGSPDFFFPAQRVAVFVDGCFWHGCPRCGRTPKANRGYWRTKLARNKRRDAQVKRTLRSHGIRILRFWECQLRDRPTRCLAKLSILVGGRHGEAQGESPS